MSKSMDDWIREETLDHESMLNHRDDLSTMTGGLLSEGDTINEALEDSFADFSAVTRELWKPNVQVAAMVKKQRMELGLGTGGIRNRKNSPTFGGRKRKREEEEKGEGEEKRATTEEVENSGDEHDFEGGAERSDRGPVIGVQFQTRLGSSSVEEILLLGSSLLFLSFDLTGSLTSRILGVGEAVSRLSKSTVARPGFSRSRRKFFIVITRYFFD
jgi:hypothetical protein